MKKLNQNFKVFSKEEISKIKGGKNTKLKGYERVKDIVVDSCPPPEPDVE